MELWRSGNATHEASVLITCFHFCFRFHLVEYFLFGGLNSGVMLMNLTRMRQMNFTSLLWPIYKKFEAKLPYGDQDILNIIFNKYPGILLLRCKIALNLRQYFIFAELFSVFSLFLVNFLIDYWRARYFWAVIWIIIGIFCISSFSIQAERDKTNRNP